MTYMSTGTYTKVTCLCFIFHGMPIRLPTHYIDPNVYLVLIESDVYAVLILVLIHTVKFESRQISGQHGKNNMRFLCIHHSMIV